MNNKDINILIVEDDLISAEYLKEILEEEGYKIAGIVDTGYGAIKEAKLQIHKNDIWLL
jgi:CheY-like chemotaxis protein